VSEPTGVLLISGVAGAGKTTVSSLVVAQLSRSALIHGDNIHNLVVSGRKHPNEEPADEASRQLHLRDRNIAALTDNLSAAGFLTVIDDVVVYRERLLRLFALITVRPIYMAMLAPHIDVAEERDRLRSEKTVFPIWSHLDAVMRREMDGIGCWVDSSKQTPDETAAEVMARVWTEGRVAP
jgi:adenylylsulfate kinase-like enzyme